MGMSLRASFDFFLFSTLKVAGAVYIPGYVHWLKRATCLWRMTHPVQQFYFSICLLASYSI